MRNRSRFGSASSKGLGIFWVMLIFLPVIGWIFGLVNFIIEHFISVIIGVGLVLGLISFICFKVSGDEEEEVEEEV